MKESVTYQAIVEEGKVEEAQKLLSRLGKKKLGAANEATVFAIHSIKDLERLERIIDRASDAASWEELLATP